MCLLQGNGRIFINEFTKHDKCWNVRSSDTHTDDNTADVREATSFLSLMLTTLLCRCCTVVIPDSSTLNILWTG